MRAWSSLRIAAFLMLALALVPPASAQSGPRRLPVYGSLFGPGEKETLRPRRLDVNWSVYSADDDNSFLATGADILDSALQSGRFYSGAAISLQYVRRPPHRVLTLTANSSARYYPDLHRIVTTRFGGGLAFDTSPSPDWRIQLSDAATFSPFYQVDLTPRGIGSTPDAPVTSDDTSVPRQHAVQYESFIGVTHTYSARST